MVIVGVAVQRHSLYLDDQSKQDAELIQRTYGLRSQAAAIRFALRELARRVVAEAPVGSMVGSRPLESEGTDRTPRD